MEKKVLEIVDLICKDPRVEGKPCEGELGSQCISFRVIDPNEANPALATQSFVADWIDKLKELEDRGFRTRVNGIRIWKSTTGDTTAPARKKGWEKPTVTGIKPTVKDPVKLVEKLQQEGIPFIVLSAKDRCAMDAIKEYYDRVHYAAHTGLIPMEFYVGIVELREAFEAFQEDMSNTKYPD